MPVNSAEHLKCPKCQSLDIVKNGSRYTKREKKARYICRRCGHSFTPNDGFLRMRGNPAVIATAVYLSHTTRLPLREIQKCIRRFHGVEVSHVAISRWVKKYEKIPEGESLKLWEMTHKGFLDRYIVGAGAGGAV